MRTSGGDRTSLGISAMGEAAPQFEAVTEGVIVRVKPSFLTEKSAPSEGRYLWMYAVEIENRSPHAIQLLTRYWRITESAGVTHEVAGEGVVGNQPVLLPGDIHRYASTAPLGSPSGLMGGRFGMIETESRRPFDVTIPTFVLASPFDTSRAN